MGLAPGLALGDVDGDGDLDLLTASSSTSQVRVRLNGGNALGTNTGGFSRGGQVAVGSNPFGLALGDVDGDGDLDLLTANLGGTVSVRLNGGDASGSNTSRFSQGSDPAVGAAPVGLALGDVDADGDLDLLTTSPAASQVSVRLNQPWALEAVAKLMASLPDSTRQLRPLAPGLLVQAYPNPSVQVPTLTIHTDQAGPATLLLADALGRQLSQQQLSLSLGTTTLPLAATQDLAAGVYLLRVRQGSQQQTIRLVRP